MSLVDKLRDSRKSPLVLKTKIMGIRSRREDIYIFIYEGPEDVAAYEEWLRRIDSPAYEALFGSGKEQLLMLRSLLDGDELLYRVYFFVDADFDEDLAQDARVYQLDAYSIENLIVGFEVLESLLRDEFRCAGLIDDKERIHAAYTQIRQDAEGCLAELHRVLFMARREGLRSSCWPDKITDCLTISLNGIAAEAINWNEKLGYEGKVAASRALALVEEFSRLPSVRSQRGKYMLQIFRVWLSLLFADRKSAAPKLFSVPLPTLGGDPQNVSIRRLASAAALPSGLVEFVSATHQEAR